jgi:ABC-2 type transport system permease protein
MSRAAGPPPGHTFRLVLGLRFILFARRLGRRGLLGAVLGGLLSAGLSGGLGLAAWWLFARVEAIAQQPVWMAFSLGLFCFLLGLFWVIWPVIAARVDEAYEMGRFIHFPIRPLRLYGLQSLVGLVEPAAVFFYPILLGAQLGLAASLEPGWPAALGLSLCFVFMCAATGRCLLNLMLNVMTSRRSGEILFAGLLLALGLAALLPPVDASWLFARLGGFGAEPRDLALLANTARAVAATPPGLLARGLAAAADGQTAAALGAGALMLACGGAAWLLGLWLLLRFYRGGRGLALWPERRSPGNERRSPGNDRRSRRRKRWRRRWLGPVRRLWPSGPLAAIAAKEVVTLARNPKGRLLFAVPFFLLIILKIIGAGQLLRYLWGDAWAAGLWSLLGAYVLSVLGGQLFGNGFGYDGWAVRWVFWAPLRPRQWLLGRNLGQGLFAGVQFAGLGALLYGLLPDAGPRLLALPLCGFAFGLSVLLAVGDLVSLRFPRRFHFSLARRDRPAAGAFFWMLAALALCSLALLAVLGLAGRSPLALHLGLLGLVGLGGAVFAGLLPRASRRLASERERLIAAVSG